jgi:hypothetical protein
MPRIRTIKPDFFTSPDVAQADFPVRLFYQALWCWADDFGIGETNLNGLLGFAFPDSDGFTAPDLRRFCADCARHFGITFYTVRGRHYYAIPTWEKHQKLESRNDRRKYPTPEDPAAVPDQRIYGCADSAPDMPRKSGAESGENGAGRRKKEEGTGEEGTSYAAPAGAAPKKGTRLQPDWMPNQSTVDAIKEETNATKDELTQQHRRFIDYWIAKAGKDGVKLDWDATWRNWMRNANQRGEIGRTTTPTGKPNKLRALADLAAEVREMENANGKAIEA